MMLPAALLSRGITSCVFFRSLVDAQSFHVSTDRARFITRNFGSAAQEHTAYAHHN